MSNRKLSAALIGVFLFGSTPAVAQDASGQAGWVDWGLDLGSKALTSVMAPIDYSWEKLKDVFVAGEAKATEEITRFEQLLKNDLETFSANVEKTGYSVTQVSFSPDFIPQIGLHLQVNKPVDDAQEVLLRKEFEESPDMGIIQRSVLLALLDVDETAADLKMDGYRFSEVELSVVAIFPEVTINFTKDDPVNQTPSTTQGSAEQISITAGAVSSVSGATN